MARILVGKKKGHIFNKEIVFFYAARFTKDMSTAARSFLGLIKQASIQFQLTEVDILSKLDSHFCTKVLKSEVVSELRTLISIAEFLFFMGFLLVIISILKIRRFICQSTFEDVKLSERIYFADKFSDVYDLIRFTKYSRLIAV